MQFLQSTTWAEALEAMVAFPGGLPVAGGTDVMVELNVRRRHPEALSAVHVAARNTSGHHGSSHEEVEEHSHAIPE